MVDPHSIPISNLCPNWMTLARLTYRATQFWKFLGARPSYQQMELARRVLSTTQMDLFVQMQPGEQTHSLEVLERLQDQGESDADLLVAALLHDVGKSRFPLNPLERAWVVVARAVFPRMVRRWGYASSESIVPRWKRAVLVAEQHPQWGADMACEAGTSSLAVTLIRRHQEKVALESSGYENMLVRKLQAVDNES